ncbi:MAG: hypothetical protein J6K43_01020 [Lachnospiraceae bacterium]|nr:hypothetical protein [Lachnospiraceae bacterium]
MSRRFTLQILLPVEGYEEDKIYKSEEITLRVTNLKQKPDNIYYRRLKDKSVYASFDDVVKFAREKYSLGEIHNFSTYTDYFGEHTIEYAGNKYVVTPEEADTLEREHIAESIYCNVFKECELSWFYTSIGDELLPDDMAIVDDELIRKAAALVGYDTDMDFTNGMAAVIETKADEEDKFIASLLLAKEIAGRVNGRAVLWYD